MRTSNRRLVTALGALVFAWAMIPSALAQCGILCRGVLAIFRVPVKSRYRYVPLSRRATGRASTTIPVFKEFASNRNKRCHRQLMVESHLSICRLVERLMFVALGDPACLLQIKTSVDK
jgi:hypothetical protein